MGKKSKKCSNKRRLLWWAFGAVGLGARVLTALSLLVIATSFQSLNKDSAFLKECIEEKREAMPSLADAVRFCNGGD